MKILVRSWNNLVMVRSYTSKNLRKPKMAINYSLEEAQDGKKNLFRAV